MTDSEYATCIDCSTQYPVDEMVSYDDQLYCQSCESNSLDECTSCGETYHTAEDGSWGGMCPVCAQEHFVCDHCDEVYHDDSYGGDGMCRYCQEEDQGEVEHIRPYHHPPYYIFHPSQKTLYFGVELETDGYDDRCAVADALFDLSESETMFFMEEDSSLHSGIEIISQPCSLAYHKHIFPWEKISSVVSRHGGKSHDTTTCGLHIHFSRRTFEGRKDKLYQLRLIYFFEKFWAEMVRFSRREGDWEHTARKYDIPIYDKPTNKKLYDIKNNFYRYQAVNLVRPDTIEIRIFRGSLKVSTILASLELVDFLIHLVKKVSNQEIQSITWAEVVERVKNSKYEYLYPYLKDIGLVEGGQNVLDSSEA